MFNLYHLRIVRCLPEAPLEFEVDVIAQSGRYPPNATSFKMVLSSKANNVIGCTWRIDRFTGQVIDKQIDVVKE